MYLAFDIGGTKIYLGVFNDFSIRTMEFQTKIPVSDSFEKDIENIKKELTTQGYTKFKAIGMGLPGIIHKEDYSLHWAGNLNTWQDHNMKEVLSEFLEFDQLYLENDVNIAAAAEVVYGGQKEDFTFIIWGTGTGCNRVRFIDGKPFFQQVELGYHIISEKVMLNGEEYPGYFEYFCGGGYFEKRLGKKLEDFDDEDWKDIFEKFAFGINNLVALNYAKKIVFSGGVINKQWNRIDITKNKLRQIREVFTEPDLELSKLGDNAGLFGGLALIKINQESI